ENSPYLLQHATNPVDWYPWGEEALEIARREDKPIFLSVGYAACHWCHVMAHESFEDADTAGIMNQHFVNIKVDREERPDIDTIYMQAVVAMTGQGGWPMSVFLTPEGEPFYGGTYFPPEPRYRMPAFRQILLSITQIWRDERGKILHSSQTLAQQLQQTFSVPNTAGNGISLQTLEQAVTHLTQAYDEQYGGWGQAPKFPQPMAIEFLLRQATRGNRAARGDQKALEIATHALRAMAKGGMYDVVGGGFARYSVDARWLVPHFEKMLYDNAQLALAYLHAYLLTGEAFFRRICEEVLDFTLREMTHPQGGFFSSLDADSEGEEGKFYVWTLEEIQEIITDPQETIFFLAAYGVTQGGNFEGKNILQRVLDDEQLAEEFDIPLEDVPHKLAQTHARLLEKRAGRIRPGTDDKVLTFWNAMMLTAFAEAGRYLRRDDYTQIAERNAEFLLENLYLEDRLLRSWRNGQAKYNAYLEDYASLILALLALYQTDSNLRWYTEAQKLGEEMVAHFSDPAGGFFDTRDDHEALLLRPKDLQDNATPSGNALAATALLQLAAYELNTQWHDRAEAMLAALAPNMARYPTGFAQWLCASDLAIGPSREVAILGERNHPETQQLIDALWQSYRPRTLSAHSPYPAPAAAPEILKNRPLQNIRPTAYVCQGYTCKNPVNTPAEMLAHLNPDSDA
ncbi:MAG: thioredoxin domain-containing protein, partial [Chloroflexi bacterium]|nr:thioredoxin domain-containing protein [Chloroflexota bacterium]